MKNEDNMESYAESYQITEKYPEEETYTVKNVPIENLDMHEQMHRNNPNGDLGYAVGSLINLIGTTTETKTRVVYKTRTVTK